MLTVLEHPLVKHKLTVLRDDATGRALFRRTLGEIAAFLLMEATRDAPLTTKPVTTPLERGDFPCLPPGAVTLVSILRAGNGLLEPMLDLMPEARAGHIGLYRDHDTLMPVEYYFKVPPTIRDALVILVDPMLATGHSADAALTRLKAAGAKRLKFCCLVAAPEGVAEVTRTHPDVPIIAAGLDRQLNDKGYILPGLGDAGDRIYGTQ
jgi:uracil phosphoribosyltransferase